jgi:hypothetical protein
MKLTRLLAVALVGSLDGSQPARLTADETASSYSRANDFVAGSIPFRESLCLNVKFAQGQPHSELPMLTDLGVRWVRDHASWKDLEPVAGQYAEFPEPFRERLRFYRQHGIGVVFLLAYDNNKAYPNTPDNPHHSLDPKAYAGYAMHAAKLLRKAGVRFKLEIWNEPHNFVMAKMLGGSWQGRPPSPWLDHYVTMVHETVAAVHAQDPKVELFTDEDAWVTHYWYLEKGLPSDIDGFAVHPYPAKAPIPEITPMSHDIEWARPFQTVDPDRSFRSAARRLREQAKSKLGRSPQVWITEIGFKIGEDTLAGRMDDLHMAAFLPRVYVVAAAAGIGATCWFSARDVVDGPVGLLDNHAKRRLAYATYRTMARELGELTLTTQLVGNEHPTTGLQAFVFRGPRGERTVAWNIDGPGELVLSPKAKGSLRVRDAFGVEQSPKREGDSYVLNIGFEPVYIDGLRIGEEALRLRPHPGQPVDRGRADK